MIDMMANDRWSDADILKRTEAMIRQYFSVDEEAVLNRKATAMALGEYQFSAQELQALALYKQVSLQAQECGRQAREDMKQLEQVFLVEDCIRELENDTEDKEKHEQLVGFILSQTEQTIELVKKRNPTKSIDSIVAGISDSINIINENV